MKLHAWAALALTLATSACHAPLAPLRIPAAAGVWLGHGLPVGDLAPEWATSGEGLPVRLLGVGPRALAGARALQWVSPAPWSLADVDRLEFVLMSSSEVVLATRQVTIGGSLPPEGLHLVLRHLKPNTQYRFKIRAFTASNESIEHPAANLITVSTEYQAAPYVSTYLPLKDKAFPGRIVATLNPPYLGLGYVRRVVLERDFGDYIFGEVASKTIGPEMAPPPVEFLGVAPGSSYRVRVELWATGAAEPTQVFDGGSSGNFLDVGDADASGTVMWSAPTGGV